jgi:hypothetical protein
MTEYFLRSDLPSMRNEAGAGGEAFQRARFLADSGFSQSPVSPGASAARRAVRRHDANLSVNS